MELFTMGRGNYTEKDIKEAARAFTGWQFKLNGEFIFRENLHDTGVKTVLGKTGNFDGDDVLDILLQQKQTATFISTKLYRFFVNNEVDEQKVKWLADRFYKSGYEIAPLLKDIFTSDWFYDQKNIGTRVKSPVDLLVGIRRSMPMQIENEDAQLYLQKILGQVLFYPPNVAGWPGGFNWIDSSSLMFRMRVPQLIATKEAFNIRAKSDDDQEMGRMQPAGNKIGGRVLQTTIRWEPAMKQLEKVSRENLLTNIATLMWQTIPSPINKQLMEKFTDAASRERFVQTTIIQLMCTPEYQMC